MEKLIKIGKEVAEKLKQLKEVKAIAFYGAVASGFADKWSDIDIVCICNKIPSIKRREKLLKELENIELIKDLPENYQKHMDFFVYKNIEITIEYKIWQNYKDILGKFKKGASLPWEKISDAINHVYYARSIYDPNKKFKELKEGIPKPNIKGEGIKWLIDLLNRTFYGNRGPWGDRVEKAIKRRNPIALNKEFTELIDAFVIYLYAINKEYYTTAKWLPQYIKKFKIKPKNCIKRLERISLLGNRPKELKEKIKIFKSLVEDTKPFIEKRLK